MNSLPKQTDPTISTIEESSERFNICYSRMRKQMVRVITDPGTNCKIMGLAALMIASNTFWESSSTIYPTYNKSMIIAGLAGIIVALGGPKFFDHLDRRN